VRVAGGWGAEGGCEEKDREKGVKARLLEETLSQERGRGGWATRLTSTRGARHMENARHPDLRY